MGKTIKRKKKEKKLTDQTSLSHYLYFSRYQVIWVLSLFANQAVTS